MEKSLNQEIKDKFAIADVDIRTYSPLTLAYIGDGIFDVIIRSIVVGRGQYAGQSTASQDQPCRQGTFAGDHGGGTDGCADGYGKGYLPQRAQCQVTHHGKECNGDGLPQCYGI